MSRIQFVLAAVLVLPAFVACDRPSRMPEAFNSNLGRKRADAARSEDLSALPIAEDPGADSANLLGDQTKLNRPLVTSLLNATPARTEPTPTPEPDEAEPTPTPEGF